MPAELPANEQLCRNSVIMQPNWQAAKVAVTGAGHADRLATRWPEATAVQERTRSSPLGRPYRAGPVGSSLSLSADAAAPQWPPVAPGCREWPLRSQARRSL